MEGGRAHPRGGRQALHRQRLSETGSQHRHGTRDALHMTSRPADQLDRCPMPTSRKPVVQLAHWRGLLHRRCHRAVEQAHEPGGCLATSASVGCQLHRPAGPPENHRPLWSSLVAAFPLLFSLSPHADRKRAAIRSNLAALPEPQRCAAIPSRPNFLVRLAGANSKRSKNTSAFSEADIRKPWRPVTCAEHALVDVYGPRSTDRAVPRSASAGPGGASVR
jgi:hypothetical protein